MATIDIECLVRQLKIRSDMLTISVQEYGGRAHHPPPEDVAAGSVLLNLAYAIEDSLTETTGDSEK